MTFSKPKIHLFVLEFLTGDDKVENRTLGNNKEAVVLSSFVGRNPLWLPKIARKYKRTWVTTEGYPWSIKIML